MHACKHSWGGIIRDIWFLDSIIFQLLRNIFVYCLLTPQKRAAIKVFLKRLLNPNCNSRFRVRETGCGKEKIWSAIEAGRGSPGSLQNKDKYQTFWMKWRELLPQLFHTRLHYVLQDIPDYSPICTNCATFSLYLVRDSSLWATLCFNYSWPRLRITGRQRGNSL